MKRLAILLLLVGCVVPLAQAQDDEHVQVGVFADYLRLDQIPAFRRPITASERLWRW